MKAAERTLHRGCTVRSGYLTDERTAALLAAVDRVRAEVRLPVVVRPSGGRALHYQVIDGALVSTHLPELAILYRQVQVDLERIYRHPLVPLADHLAALNVNITPPGGAYRWHYDRNAVTAVLYLNDTTGGQLEMCPNYRVTSSLLRRARRLQQALDAALLLAPMRRLAGRPQLVDPAAGTIVMMRGDHCLHSVRPVSGTSHRVSVVMSFDLAGRRAAANQSLNSYLYSTGAVSQRDPNYAEPSATSASAFVEVHPESHAS